MRTLLMSVASANPLGAHDDDVHAPSTKIRQAKKRSALISHLRAQADARQNRQVVRIARVRGIVVVADARDISGVVDVEDVQIRGERSPWVLPRFVDAQIE